MRFRVLALLTSAVTLLSVGAALPVRAATTVVIGMSKVQFDPPGSDLPVTNAQLNGEYVVVKNFSPTSYNVAGWTVRDDDGHVYTFPSYTLAGGASVVVHTGTGADRAGHLYQDVGYYIWNNSGDHAYLRAPSGLTVNTCTWVATGTGSTGCPSAKPVTIFRARGDFNGDGRADVAVFRPSTGTWYVRGVIQVRYGVAGDVPVPADFNGDGRTDVAVFRPSTGTWYVRGVIQVRFGVAGDVPVPADFNGDGRADIAVFRPSTGTWYLRGLGAGAYGQSGDRPVAADYNGDRRADLAVFRPATGMWYLRKIGTAAFGVATDRPVPADYNGDGRTDIAVFRPSTGTWYVRGIATIPWGASADIPVT